MSNPYSLTFGREPYRLISRAQDINDITECFNSDTPSTYVYIITGVRGAGKTVALGTIIDRLEQNENWIIALLNPNRDMLGALAASLYEHPFLKAAFIKADIKLSMGVELGVKSEGPHPDIEIQLEKMLRIADKLGKKILIAVDEASNSKEFKILAGAYQIFLLKKLPVFMLMTGLYHNIYALQNEKTLTFLYRAPKIVLSPLNMIAMSNSYQETLDIDQEEADCLARFTKGYSYAFQVTGYLKYENRDMTLEQLSPRFDEIMAEYSYEKIWDELSGREKEIVRTFLESETDTLKVKDIKLQAHMTDQSFPTYRRRLSGGGVISVNDYGYCSLALPRFREIISRII